MTRACHALTFLLVALGGSLLVTSSARCQINADYNRSGPRYHEPYPYVDGYIQTHEEAVEPTQASETTEEVDLRGRAVVVVLDDPIAMEAQEAQEVEADTQLVTAPVKSAATVPATDPALANTRYSTGPTESIDGNEAAIDAYNYGYRYKYMMQYGYYGQRYPEYHNANVAASGQAVSTEPTPAVVAEANSSNDSSSSPTPNDVYDYVHHYDRAFDASSSCQAEMSSAASQVVNAVVPGDTQSVVARDCENEVYQAYLQRCAEDAVTRALTAQSVDNCEHASPYEPYGYEFRGEYGDTLVEERATVAPVTANVAEQSSTAAGDEYAPYEPYDADRPGTPCPAATEQTPTAVTQASRPAAYDAYGYDYGHCQPYHSRGSEMAATAESSADEMPAASTPAATGEPAYDVYDYDNGCQPGKSAETPAHVDSSPYQPNSYGRHPYGYGYEYDYEYHKEYRSTDHGDALPETSTPETAVPANVDVQPLLDLGRLFLRSLVESDLVGVVRIQAVELWTQVAEVVEYMEFDRIGQDMTQALTEAIQQPVQSDWSEANVFLLMFDSDLPNEPATDIEAEETPWLLPNQVVEGPMQDAQDTAIVSPATDDSTVSPLSIDRDQVIDWTRRAMNSASQVWGRLAVVLQHFADRSLATVPHDNPSSTTQR